jgi:large subunit ribosomal protein L15
MTRKSKKAKKMRGSHTHGYGSKKKHRGAGSRGGVGYGGSFQHKKVFLRKKEPGHFAKEKFKSLRRRGILPSLAIMNLSDLPNEKEVEFKKTKILGKGIPPKGIVVKASLFSGRAKEKIESAGGKAIQV